MSVLESREVWLLAPQLSCERAPNREGMSREGEDLSHDGLGLMEDAKLSEYRAAVVIDSLSSEAIAGVERIHTAKRERDPSSGRGEAAPGAEVRPANHDFHENGVAGDVAPLNVDPEIGQRLHELSVKSSDAVPAVVVFIPRLIVISRRIAEGTENAFEIMLVFAPDVFLHQCDSGRDPVHRNGCGRHVPLPRLRCLEHSEQPAYANCPTRAGVSVMRSPGGALQGRDFCWPRFAASAEPSRGTTFPSRWSSERNFPS